MFLNILDECQDNIIKQGRLRWYDILILKTNKEMIVYLWSRQSIRALYDNFLRTIIVEIIDLVDNDQDDLFIL